MTYKNKEERNATNHRVQIKDTQDARKTNELISKLKNLGCNVEIKGRWTEKGNNA